MFIYIDESGIFSNPRNVANSISCIGAVVVPESCHREVIKNYKKIKKELKQHNGEVKGSKLEESDVNRIVEMLLDRNILFFNVGIDMSINNDKIVQNHKFMQSKNITKNLTKDHHQTLVNQLEELKIKMERMPNQLYAQNVCLYTLVEEILRLATIYYSFNDPPALFKFCWRIDSKNKRKTQYEHVWSMTILPILQTMSLIEPFYRIIEGDYSYYERFDEEYDEVPKHLVGIAKVKKGEKFPSVDIKKIMMEDIQFVDSNSCNGIQLADILVNATRRALRGNLKIQGWGKIGMLMPYNFMNKQAIKLISFTDYSGELSYSPILKYFKSVSKRII